MNICADVVRTDACSTTHPDGVVTSPAGDHRDDVTELATVFSLLGDPGRLRLLIALRAGELCVCDLAAVSGSSESATSHALRLLRAHRVVSVRRAGRRAYYRLDDGHVEGLLALGAAHLDHASGDDAGRGTDPIQVRP